jgi:tungstate transport system ATP-binding protein
MKGERTEEGILEVRDVKVAYGDRTVLSVEGLAALPGEILAIVGPNGAGKSTLLRILALLEAPTTGVTCFKSEPVRYEPGPLLALRRRMATVFQSPLLCNMTTDHFPHATNCFRSLSKREIGERVRRWAERFGVSHLLGQPARTLSGGEAQRVSLARAFALNPEVLFLDEPFSALDQPTREGLLTELEGVLRESKITTVFVTHERNEALQFGDRVAVVMGGRLAQVDSPERVFSSPVNEEVARFVGVENILRGVILEQRDGIGVVSLDFGKIQVATEAEAGERILVCLRPEEIVLARPDASFASESMRNVLRGKIHNVIPLGAQLRVQMDTGVTLTALITKQSWQELRLAEGREAQVAFKASAAHVIRRRASEPPGSL